ncbi:MAG: dephospho-CoA kinase [Caulobacteraceae bacterium]|nr:dephospho-CoA kinase [Caulobacteraceae bacterium]
MIVLGLTGSIGMGKSTTARLFAEEGAAVFDVDASIHQLYQPGEAGARAVGAAFPGVLDMTGAVDRAALSRQVVGDPAALIRLESLVHPLVRESREVFLETARRQGARVAVVDIPLLFETGQKDQLDKVVVVSAPEAMQRERVLARTGMTEEKFAALLARQTPDAEKRARADFVIDTGNGVEMARTQVRDILGYLSRLPEAAKPST